MSKVKKKRASNAKKITPILQTELIRQLSKIADALDTEDLPLAWRAIQTMIGSSPPDIRKACDKDLGRIRNKIRELQTVTGLDLYQTRVKRSRRMIFLLTTELRPLHTKIWDLLYEGQYLEYESFRVTEDTFKELDEK